jgi:hypothetical protein
MMKPGQRRDGVSLGEVEVEVETHSLVSLFSRAFSPNRFPALSSLLDNPFDI